MSLPAGGAFLFRTGHYSLPESLRLTIIFKSAAKKIISRALATLAVEFETVADDLKAVLWPPSPATPRCADFRTR
jgi:hypothetical protein